MTGNASSTFSDSAKGAEALFNSINAAGGINGRKINMITTDDQFREALAPLAGWGFAGMMAAAETADGFSHAFGVTYGKGKDASELPEMVGPLAHSTWLNKPNIEKKAGEMDVPLDEWLATVVVHEFKHESGYGEPEAFAAGTAFARRIPNDRIADESSKDGLGSLLESLGRI